MLLASLFAHIANLSIMSRKQSAAQKAIARDFRAGDSGEENVDALDKWSEVTTKAEAVKLYAEMQQDSLHGFTAGNIPEINTILISKFGMKGLNEIKMKAVKTLK